MRTSLFWLTLCCTTAGLCLGQARSDGSLDDEISVALVTLDVFVADKKGKPVGGLTIDDFKVLEDGVAVDVDSFQAITGGPSDGAAAQSSSRNRTPLTVAVYLDESLLLPTDWARVRGPISTFIKDSVPADAGLILARHGSGLDIVVEYADSKASMIEQMETLIVGMGGIGDTLEQARALDIITGTIQLFGGSRLGSDADCADFWQQGMAAGRAYASESGDRLTKSVTSLARFVSSLSGIPGRKSLLYVSGGLQMQPGSDLFYALSDACPDRQSEVVSVIQEYQEISTLNSVAAHANANRVTLYPLDAAGIRSSASSSQSQFQSVASLKDSLVLLGRETGGRAILNAADPTKALAELKSDFQGYYEITYRPNRRFQAPNHLIDVRLTDRGKRSVRYRRTVAPKTTSESLAERLISALVLGVEDNALNATVEVQTPTLVSRDVVRQPIKISIPKSSLLVLDGELAPASGVRLFLVARDAKNRGSDVREYFVSAEEMTASGEVLEYVVTLELEPSDYQIAVGIRDERAKKASYLRRRANLEKVEEESNGTSRDEVQN